MRPCFFMLFFIGQLIQLPALCINTRPHGAQIILLPLLCAQKGRAPKPHQFVLFVGALCIKTQRTLRSRHNWMLQYQWERELGLSLRWCCNGSVLFSSDMFPQALNWWLFADFVFSLYLLAGWFVISRWSSCLVSSGWLTARFALPLFIRDGRA